jgi:hypothetical protein
MTLLEGNDVDYFKRSDYVIVLDGNKDGISEVYTKSYQGGGNFSFNVSKESFEKERSGNNYFSFPSSGIIGDGNGDGYIENIHKIVGDVYDIDDYEDRDLKSTIDINGDGRTDLFFKRDNKIFINKKLYKNKLTDKNYKTDFSNKNIFQELGINKEDVILDVNNDSLDDFISGDNLNINAGDGKFNKKFLLSEKNKNIKKWSNSLTFIDINGDGLKDKIESIFGEETIVYIGDVSGNYNKSNIKLDGYFSYKDYQNNIVRNESIKFSDFNGDGILDILHLPLKKRHNVPGSYHTISEPILYLGKSDMADLIKEIKEGDLTISPEFKMTSELRTENGELLNPLLHTPFLVLNKISHNSDFGNKVEKKYIYSGGKNYFYQDFDKEKYDSTNRRYQSNNSKRAFSFETTEEIDLTKNTSLKTFYHQENNNKIDNNKIDENYEKIGKAYKTQFIDKNTNKVLEENIFS